MSDRSYFQLYVYDCPPDEVTAVLAVLEKYEVDLEFRREGTPEGALVIGEQYRIEEAGLDIVDEIAPDLEEAAPNATWACWQDPKYEYAGMLAYQDPTLGAFRSECDSNGVPLFSGEAIKGWLEFEAPTATLDYFFNEVWPKRTGWSWEKRQAELRQQHVRVLLPTDAP